MKGVDFDENIENHHLCNNHHMWCYRHQNMQMVKRPCDGIKRKEFVIFSRLFFVLTKENAICL